MSDIVLHGYQQRLKSGIYDGWNQGNKNVLAVLPTGGGKSIVVSDVVKDGYEQGLSQPVVAHRNELVSQMSIHIANRGIPHKIIGSKSTISEITRLHRTIFGQSFINPNAKTSVVGVDTLISRKDVPEIQKWAAQQDRFTIDEGHHVLRENKWGKACEMFTNARGLLVTATPSRADGKGLGRHADGVVDYMVLGPSMRELIEWGNLSDYEIVCPLSDLQMSDDDLTDSGDYSGKKMRDKAKKSHIVGDVVENYCKYAFGKSAIVFATDIETAGKISDNFNKFGIRAASLSSQTPSAVREKYVKEFKSGKLMVLINVDLFDEGFDVPRCEVVIMARPTASLGKYLQMVGRGLRKFDGKPYGLIIDHVSNVIRHGLPDKPRVWTLDRRDKRGKSVKDPDDIPLTPCKTCSKPYERFRPCCPYCGAVPPLPDPKDRSIAQIDGDLILLDRAKLEEMRAATILQNPGDVGSYVAHYHGPIAGKGAMNRQIEKIEAQNRLKNALAQWGAIQRHAGFTDSEAYRKFYITTGMDIITALSADKSRQEYDAIATMVEGWYNR